ncbi:iron chelate uptake ABC transporter family permease subunit [Alkaliphilus transvaalensis]|uniref:iron chelate uptake ABC transporter family permease subunit n=1 Tax=Alkaliphilus transvaalensis TaxID=114628 RepID=UPI00047A3D06|nr:iron chelate uptake ABC transporter family permease subunit [Alkaliphilus transvaalensis]
MTNKRKLILLTIILAIVTVLFLTLGLNSRNWNYGLSRRLPMVAAILLTGSSIAFSSIIFQTITNNRILTPSVLGLDSLYMFIQTFVIFVFGSLSIAASNRHINFVLSVGLMICFSILLFNFLFKREGNSVFFLLLVGMVFGTFFQSLSSFMQMVIDPNEFLIVQNRSFASFSSINTNLLTISFISIIGVFLLTFKDLKMLDVISLGKDEAISLGVNYDRVVKKMLIAVAVLISVSTALVGPITFLGILVANLARQFIHSYKHKFLITGAILISGVALVGGQLIAERVMNFSTPISVIINFVGGMYFIYLLLRESRI